MKGLMIDYLYSILFLSVTESRKIPKPQGSFSKGQRVEIWKEARRVGKVQGRESEVGKDASNRSIT